MRQRLLTLYWGAFALGLLGIAILGTAGCAPASEREDENPSQRASAQSGTESNGEGGDAGKSFPEYWYEVDVQSAHAQIIVLLNGFPVYETGYGMKSDDHIDLPMNTALVGEGNTFGLRVEPWMHRSDGDLQIGSVEVTARVSLNEEKIVEGSGIRESRVDSAYKAWAKRAREKWTEYREWEKRWLKKNPGAKEEITWKEGGALDSMRAWAERNPMVVSTTFDNEAGPDFSAIFEEAPVIEDTARLKDYAMHLRDLLRSGNAEALYREIGPSISEETGWFKVTREGTRKAALTEIREGWSEDYRTDFPRSKIRLRKWCGGRVWELYVIGPTGQRRTFFSEGPSASHLEVYVGEIDGKLRIVRLT